MGHPVILVGTSGEGLNTGSYNIIKRLHLSEGNSGTWYLASLPSLGEFCMQYKLTVSVTGYEN